MLSRLLKTVGGWFTYILCATMLVVVTLDGAGVPLMGFVLLGTLCLLLALVVHIVLLAIRWRRFGWRTVLPVLVCLAVLPAGSALGNQLYRARFYWNRSRYEFVAEGIRSGSHREALQSNESRLGYWVSAIRAPDVASAAAERGPSGPVLAVDFLTVTHGFAGHRGFMRVFDAQISQRLQWLRNSVDIPFALLGVIATFIALGAIPDSDYYGFNWLQRESNISAYAPPWHDWTMTCANIWIWSEVVVMLFNKKRRAFHDFIAGTVVVAENREVIPDITPPGDTIHSIEPVISTQWQVAICGAALLVASCAVGLLSASTGNSATQGIRLGLAITLGPILGWWTAISRADIGGAVGLLTFSSTICLIPLSMWFWRRSPWLAALGTGLWFLFGWYFAIGMWI